ncbi:hypothetical protein DYH09_05020 [bacterium CPR1]|nr:hypothetical protein [bacterium CPR1]
MGTYFIALGTAVAYGLGVLVGMTVLSYILVSIGGGATGVQGSGGHAPDDHGHGHGSQPTKAASESAAAVTEASKAEPEAASATESTEEKSASSEA